MSCKWPSCSCRATGIYCKDKPGKKDKKPIVKQSAKKKIEQKEDTKIRKIDHEMYLEIASERPHVCDNCNVCIFEIGDKNFHHILPKRKTQYPQYRHKKWNITVLCWQCHSKAENNLDFAPRIKQVTEYLLSLHEQGKLASDTENIYLLWKRILSSNK